MTKIADQPHHRVTVRELTEEQIALFIDNIRARRMEPVRIYEEAQKLKALALKGKLIARLDKKLVLFKKKLAIIDKHITDLERKGYDIKVLLFEINELGGLDEESRSSGST